MTLESRKQLKACLFLDLILEDLSFGLGVVLDSPTGVSFPSSRFREGRVVTV